MSEPAERTYISVYELEDFKGKVLSRSHLNLPWNHDKVWKKARKLTTEHGGKSFALLQFITGRNVEEEPEN